MQTMKAYVAANCGRVAQLAGDAIMAELKDVDSALHCAINMQLATRFAPPFGARAHILRLPGQELRVK